jgi:hypothetical protein
MIKRGDECKTNSELQRALRRPILWKLSTKSNSDLKAVFN